jgi:endonuclease V-like protein UPF0215 family
MAKKKPDLASLEVELRDSFQKYRRRLDMLTRFRALGKVSEEQVDEFIKAMNQDDELTARKVMKIIEVQRGS